MKLASQPALPAQEGSAPASGSDRVCEVGAEPLSPPVPGWQRPLLLLAILAATHFLVDVVAGTTSPIWPALETNLRLPTGGLLWVYAVWSVATSFSQLLIGMWADRSPSRWLVWVGPLVAILCISCVGLASTAGRLAALVAVGGLGVAAFHPEAAAMAGSLFPQQRSRAMAVFALCGYLGQSVGPYYSGVMTDWLGMRGLLWGVVWMLPALLLLWLGLRQAPHSPCAQPDQPLPQRAAQIPVRLFVLLLSVGALRILPALGVPLALAYLLEATASANAVIGAVQSAFMGGIGVGAMACAAFLDHRLERTALWFFPLLTAPLLACLAGLAGWWLVGLVALCGVLLGVTMPVYISYGQQLLPHGQRVASSITMGVSWGIGGALVAIAIRVFTRLDALPWIFAFFATASLCSSALCCFLPPPARVND